MVLVYEYPGIVLDIQYPFCFQIGSRPLGKVLAPLEPLLVSHLALVDALRGRVLHQGEHSVSETLAQIGHLVEWDAINVDTKTHGEGAAILNDLDLVNQGSAQLVGGHLPKRKEGKSEQG